jgi:hypothetical protein
MRKQPYLNDAFLHKHNSDNYFMAMRLSPDVHAGYMRCNGVLLFRHAPKEAACSARTHRAKHGETKDRRRLTCWTLKLKELPCKKIFTRS